MSSTLRYRAVVFPQAGLIALLALAFAVRPALGQAPTIASLSPLGVRPGQTQDIVIRGGALAGASQFWTSFPAKAILTPQPANNGKNAGEVSFRLTVPAQTPPGIFGTRIATDRGISPLRLLMVDDLPPIAQRPGNTTPAAAQTVSLPAAIDGAINPLERHYYKFHVEPGQRVALEVFARRIGSALDPTMRLLDSTGREVTYSDDVPGMSEDAAIDQVFTKAGDYLVELGDNLYQGGGNYFYRLRIGDFPGAVMPMPLGATRGSEVAFRFGDKSGTEIEPTHVRVPSDPLLSAVFVPARTIGGSTRSFASVVLSDHKQFSEIEPNNNAKSANRTESGWDINGRLEGPGDVDRFVFAGKAGQKVRWTAFARRLGSPADVVLRLSKVGGSGLGSAEGTAADEADLKATLPADGEYVLEVRDLNHRGGPRYVYHVEAAPAEPGFSLEASADSLNVPAGGTAIVTVMAKRSGYGGPIAINAVGLPAGISSVRTMLGPAQHAVVLSLQSAASAGSGTVHPIRIIGSIPTDKGPAGKGPPGKSDLQATATVIEAIKPHLGNMPAPPPALASATAVGIGPRPNFTLHSEPAEIVFGRNRSAKVKVIAERQKGFDEEISLEVVSTEPPATPTTRPKPPLPDGITASLKPISKGASSVEITFAANNNAMLGEYTTVLRGTLKKGNGVYAEPVPGIGLKLVRSTH